MLNYNGNFIEIFFSYNVAQLQILLKKVINNRLLGLHEKIFTCIDLKIIAMGCKN